MAVDRSLSSPARALHDRINQRTAQIDVIGLGYVGLPLAVEFAKAGFPVVGIDVDRERVAHVNRGASYIGDVPTAALQEARKNKRLEATADFGALSKADVAVICVQTPFTPTKEPDLSFVTSALREISTHLRPGQLVILQSTTYPGTTEEVALPILAGSGLRVGEEYFLAFSPERVDPGNPTYSTHNIPKVVGGVTPVCTELAQRLFEQIVTHVYPVSGAKVAELTKLLENIFRSVNIALVNEMAHLCARMGVDVWEVVSAAATKPFGYMPFYPGPGVGGHCIPVDPYYLSWKAKEFDFNTRFIALAAEINENMPYYVVERVTEAVNVHARKSVAESRILVLGVSYKPGVGDVRESPAVKVVQGLRRRGATVAYHDPQVSHLRVNGREDSSVPLSAEEIAKADCVLVLTDHPEVDYAEVARHARLVFDTRNIMRRFRGRGPVILTL